MILTIDTQGRVEFAAHVHDGAGNAIASVAGGGFDAIASTDRGLCTRSSLYGWDEGVSAAFVPLQCTDAGYLWVQSAGGQVAVTGTVPHDTAASDLPVLVGGYASAAAPSAVSADGDAVRGWYTRYGSQAVTLADGSGNLPASDASDPSSTGIPLTTRGLVTRSLLHGYDSTNSWWGGLKIDTQGRVVITQTDVIMTEGAQGHDAASTTKPFLAAGYASASAPTAVSADGDVCRVWVDRNGRLQIGVEGQALTTATAAPGTSDRGLVVREAGRDNLSGTLLTSAARTTQQTVSGPTNYNARGVIVYLNVTAASGTGGLQVLICGTDPVTGSRVQLNATPTAVTATGLRAYEVAPGGGGAATGTGNGHLVQSTARQLPRDWAVIVLVGDASSYTYSLGYQLVL